ncbi:MAG: hypothetical protein A3J51_02505 [Omnitrophica WOR_2 bacterium RIFCSPHIGHO2_02_FULL_45_21]|nr:MAG: hypothetical protein A3J51_02505 [Omnitrophica WOR_2 bacterium RIFCSPHIGHO2_02_FULL_45_21]
MKNFLKAVIIISVIAAAMAVLAGCGRRPKESPHKMPDVRPPDISKAIEIPGVPYRVIPNELVVLLKEDRSVESFKKSIAGEDIKIVGQIPVFRIVQLEVPLSRREELKEKLRKNPNVEAVVYQSVFKTSARFNDPVFTNDNPWDDWNLKAINAEAAWDITRGNPNIVIAIVDTGTLLEHEELKGRIALSGSGRAQDRRSQVGTADDLMHGTHVAITAAGSADNAAGTSGVAPGVSIMPVQVGLVVSDTLAGVAFAVQNRANVINLSIAPSFLDSYIEDYQDPDTQAETLGYFLSERKEDQQVVDKVFAACEAMGAVVVVAAGNDTLPGDFNAFVHSPFSLAVGAVGMYEDGTIALTDFSNYGYMVRVSAPGYSVYSGVAQTPSSYDFAAGTSMAAPHVSGLAGLILSVNPKLTPQEVRQVIIASAFSEGKEGGLRWHNEPRWVNKEMDSWRKAYLLLMGKDEELLLDNLAQYHMLSLIPVERNFIWTRGKDAVGAFIDARAALELAKSGEFRKRFVVFSKEDYARAQSLKAERLAQVQDMVKFRDRYAATDEVPSFELKLSDGLDKLIVVRDEKPSSDYAEWLECIEPGRYRHFAGLGGEDYSQGAVELTEGKAGLTIKNLRRKADKSYAFLRERASASQPPKGFYTIAGGSEPNRTGKLAINYIGPQAQPEEEKFYAYQAGAEPKPENILYAAKTGEAVEMITGIYDIRILSRPHIWFRGVSIEEGKTIELEAGGYGKILITGDDAVGKPIKDSFFMYDPQDRDNVLTSGTVNTPLDALSGGYYVFVDLDPDITFEGVVVRRGETTTLELPKRGRLNIAANDFEGKSLKIHLRVYKKGDWKETLEVGYTNEPEDLPPGEYNVEVNSQPDAKYVDVMIKPGEITEIKLPKFGALLIKGLDASGKQLTEQIYLYLAGADGIIASGPMNKRLDLPAGEYDLRIGLKGNRDYKGIKIEPGKVFEIELPG